MDVGDIRWVFRPSLAGGEVFPPYDFLLYMDMVTTSLNEAG